MSPNRGPETQPGHFEREGKDRAPVTKGPRVGLQSARGPFLFKDEARRVRTTGGARMKRHIARVAVAGLVTVIGLTACGSSHEMSFFVTSVRTGDAETSGASLAQMPIARSSLTGMRWSGIATRLAASAVTARGHGILRTCLKAAVSLHFRSSGAGRCFTVLRWTER